MQVDQRIRAVPTVANQTKPGDVVVGVNGGTYIRANVPFNCMSPNEKRIAFVNLEEGTLTWFDELAQVTIKPDALLVLHPPR